MKIGAVVLAAGGSSRFGRPKQLLQFGGEPLLRRAVLAALQAGCEPVAAVVGDARAEMESALAETDALLVENRHWREGIGSSIRLGMQTLVARGEQLEGVILLACDQPHVDRETVTGLIETRAETGKPIVASAYAGTFGIPALFDAARFGDLLALGGDNGAKSLIASRMNAVALFAFPKGAIDIDTPADFDRLNSAG